MKFMTIITLVLTDEPVKKLDCKQGCRAHGSIIFASSSDALEWLDTKKFKPTDEKGVFKRGRFATAIISTVN